MAKPLRKPAATTASATVTTLPVVKVAPPAKKEKTPAEKLTSKKVLAWLAKHPRFLNDHADKLGRLAQNPKNVKLTTNLLSLHAVQAQQAQKHAEKLSTRQQRLVAAAQANAATTHTIHTAVLQVMQLTSLAELRQWLQTAQPQGLTGLLALDAVRFYRTGGRATSTTLTAAEVLALAPQPVTLRTLTTVHERELYGPKGKLIAADALLRLDHPTTGKPLGLVALGSTDATRFHAGQGTDLAEFLARALACRLSGLTA